LAEISARNTGSGFYAFSGPDSNPTHNVRLWADIDQDSSYVRVWGTNSNVYGSLATEPDKSFLWGYADDQAYNYRVEAGDAEAFYRLYNNDSSIYQEGLVNFSDGSASLYGFSVGENNYLLKAAADASFLNLFPNGNNTFAEMRQDALTATVYGYAGSGSHNFILSAADGPADSSFLRVYGTASNVYATLATEPDKSFLWGYANNQAFSYEAEATASAAEFRATNNSGPQAKLYVATTAGVSVSDSNSIYSTMEPSSLFLVENSNETTLWAEGLTISDGSTTIDIQIAAADGKNIALREMEICGGDKILVLCSEPYS
jgi:hypothetical protein